jgi:hypothetical protein
MLWWTKNGKPYGIGSSKAISTAQPGSVQGEHRHGAGHVAQVKILTVDGRWAVGKQELRSIAGRLIGERDAYFAETSSFDAELSAG